MSASEICVVGAGVVGRRICRALEGTRVTIASRHIAEAGDAHLVDATNVDALARVLAGAKVVINAAGPLRDTAAPVLEAAIAAGAHYLDVGGEQAVMQALYERRESAVRRSGLIAMPGAGLDCMLGDLAIAWAAAHLCGTTDDGAPTREAPAPRLAEDQPLDEAIVTYVFDDLAVSAGSQRAMFGGVGQPALVWRRDRWEPGRVGDRRRINAGVAMGGERDAIAHRGGDPLTVPRHVAAKFVASYVSTTRNPASGALLRLLSTAATMLPKSAAGVLAPHAPPEAELARTTFAVVAQCRRGFSASHVVIRGRDPYRTTAAIAAWVARALVARGVGPTGMRAPGELFRGAPTLRELARAADLTIEPSFGATR